MVGNKDLVKESQPTGYSEQICSGRTKILLNDVEMCDHVEVGFGRSGVMVKPCPNRLIAGKTEIVHKM